MIKSGLTSTSSSIAASKRTLTSNDGVLVAESDPPPPPPAALPQSSSDTEEDLATATDAGTQPSCRRAGRCAGGYSTFTPADRRTAAADHTSAAPPGTTSTDTVVDDGTPRVSEVPRGGQQCRLTLVDDMIADVRTLSNGGGGVVNAEDFLHRHPVSEDAAAGPAQDSQVSSTTDVKVMFRSLITTCEN